MTRRTRYVPKPPAERIPVKVMAGKIGATKRWGAEPRVIRIGDLDDAQRRTVVALVRALREGTAP